MCAINMAARGQTSKTKRRQSIAVSSRYLNQSSRYPSADTANSTLAPQYPPVDPLNSTLAPPSRPARLAPRPVPDAGDISTVKQDVRDDDDIDIAYNLYLQTCAFRLLVQRSRQNVAQAADEQLSVLFKALEKQGQGVSKLTEKINQISYLTQMEAQLKEEANLTSELKRELEKRSEGIMKLEKQVEDLNDQLPCKRTVVPASDLVGAVASHLNKHLNEVQTVIASERVNTEEIVTALRGASKCILSDTAESSLKLSTKASIAVVNEVCFQATQADLMNFKL